MITFKQVLLVTVTFFSLSIQFVSANADLTSVPMNQNLVKAGDKYITLLGTQVNVGDSAPSFKVVDGNFKAVTLNDYAKQTLLISVVPSLDTGVCSIQTKRFNKEASELPENITLLTISNDLPFAQKRFCKVEGVEDLTVLSDTVWRDFGLKYGLLIKDMGLLTRAIFIIDDKGNIAYKEIVANLSSHPDYDRALKVVKKTAPEILEQEE
ncbi:MAG: thiol peroxidase [Colwellia sp.]